MKKATLILSSLAFLLASGCGSSDGSDEPAIHIVSPDDDASYRAGEGIIYAIHVDNFSLAVPLNLRSALRHAGEEHSTTDMDMSSTETNPEAREGHYHIYLDDHAGADSHVTAWTEEGVFELPLEIEPGHHSLRFELRDNEHIIVGTPESEASVHFMVVE
ncbi:MAG: hypothetical protein PHC51_08760 [bacterium]|nr:hypothetical protein [bacterium]